MPLLSFWHPRSASGLTRHTQAECRITTTADLLDGQSSQVRWGSTSLARVRRRCPIRPERPRRAKLGDRLGRVAQLIENDVAIGTQTRAARVRRVEAVHREWQADGPDGTERRMLVLREHASVRQLGGIEGLFQ